MDRLTLKQYREMVDEIIQFKKINGEMPEYTLIDGYKIEKKDYIDMIERVNKFILEMRRNPRTVDIESSKEKDSD
jgi:Pseudomurein-binding repeat